MLTLNSILRTTRQMTAFGECGTGRPPDLALERALGARKAAAKDARDREGRSAKDREETSSR